MTHFYAYIKRILVLIAAALSCAGALAQVNIYTNPPAYNSSSVTVTGGTISGVGKDTMESDAAARATNIGGSNAYPNATVNTTGGNTILSPGTGRRLVTVVDYSLIDAGVDTITITVDGSSNIGTEGANDATHWLAATSNAVTATNICTWADQLAGVTATASGSSCYITADAATYSLTLATSMAAGEGTVTSGTDGNLTIVGGSGTNKLDNVVIGDATPLAGTFTTGKFTAANLVKTAPAISAGTITLDLSTANFFNVPLGANVTTTTVSNPAASGTVSSFSLIYRADGTPRTISWMSGATWLNNGGAAPTPSSTSGNCDKYTAFTYDGGTTWYVTVDAQNFTCGA